MTKRHDLEKPLTKPPEGKTSFRRAAFSDNPQAETLVASRPAIGDLQRQNEFLRAVLDSIQSPFIVINAETHQVEASNIEPGLVEEGISCYSLTRGLDGICNHSKVFCPIEEAKATGYPVLGEHPYQGISGNHLSYSQPIFDGEGNVTFVLQQFISATDSCSSYNGLRGNDDYRILLETVPNIVYRIDPEGHFTYLNGRIEILGYQPEELIGEHFSKIVHPEDLPGVTRSAVVEELRRRGICTTAQGVPAPKLFDEQRTPPRQTDNLQLRLIPKGWSGEQDCMVGALWSYGQLSAAGYYVEQKFLGTVGVVQDITTHKNLERELQKREKLEAVGLLAGGIAHDFNNALTSVLALIGMAKRLTDDERSGNLLEQAEEGIVRATGLTRQLLTFSKGHALVVETASIKDLLEETTRFILAGSATKVTFDIPSGIWSVNIDVAQIGQVIQNIVQNADQAMSSQGRLDISVRNHAVGKGRQQILDAGSYLEITFQDNGIGIPEKILPKIFDPFFSTKRTGHGLGLATCYSIVKKHKGDIVVESEQGAGTTFHVFLPADPDTKARLIPKASSELIEGQGNILLMDDEQPIRQALELQIGTLGYGCVCASNGEEAVQLFEEAIASGNPFSAVILDLTIVGGMGGEETARKIKELDPEARLIVSSGYSTSDCIENPEAYGFCGVLPKPYNLASLSKALHNATKGQTD